MDSELHGYRMIFLPLSFNEKILIPLHFFKE